MATGPDADKAGLSSDALLERISRDLRDSRGFLQRIAWWVSFWSIVSMILSVVTFYIVINIESD